MGRAVRIMRNHGKCLREIAKTLVKSLHFVQNANIYEYDWQKDHFTPLRAISAEIDNKISPATVRHRLVQSNLPGRIARKSFANEKTKYKNNLKNRK